jgi:DNA-binding response OmpR family regulator
MGEDALKLLVVEDEARMVQLLRRGLTEEGHTVVCASDGSEGLELARNYEFDVIILDIMMPKLNGYELAQRLRHERVATPVLMLTAKDSVPDVVRGLDAGADDYLTKPFAFEELLARLRALMRREQKNGHANRLQVADLVLDLKTHQVRRGDTPIELTAREFALLEFLMRHPNQVLTQAQIAERVWDYNFEGTTNRVAVYISYLRDKIDEGRSPKLIQTVYGVGYRLSG